MLHFEGNKPIITPMSELIRPIPEDPFLRLMTEKLADKEFDSRNIRVIAVGGLPGTGATSTTTAVSDIITAETDIPVHAFSFEQERRRIYHELTGHYESPEGDTELEIHVGLATDLFMAEQMISPENSNSFVIIDGRLGPYIAKKMLFTGKSLENQGRLRSPLPFKPATVYLHATEDVRHTRKFLQAVRQQPMLNFDGYRESLRRELVEEQRGFAKAYPDLLGKTLNNMAAQLGGEYLYDMRFDTSTHTANEIALNILSAHQTQQLLSIPSLDA